MIINLTGLFVNDQIFTCWSVATLLSRAKLKQQHYTNAEFRFMKTSREEQEEGTACRATKLYRDIRKINFSQHYHL